MAGAPGAVEVITMNSILYNAIAAAIERRNGEPRISASWVANEAIMKIDPGRISVPAIYAAALEHAKQHARALLRNNPQHELFTKVQAYYPAARSKRDDPEYVRRDYDCMSQEDVDYNALRLGAASDALAKHRDALLAWWDMRPKKAERQAPQRS